VEILIDDVALHQVDARRQRRNSQILARLKGTTASVTVLEIEHTGASRKTSFIVENTVAPVHF